MASRKEEAQKASAGRSNLTRTTTAAPPSGLSALQGGLGNAVMTAWLRGSSTVESPRPDRETHEHRPGGGHHEGPAHTPEVPLPARSATDPTRRGTSVGGTGAGPLGTAAMVALQRSAGNAGVSMAIHRSAEHVAEREEDVHSGHDSRAAPHVQRLAVREVLRSPGRPMETGLRQEMEQRFGGADFGSVRFHTGTLAAQSAAELQASAYTSGADVVFGQGVERNKRVVAHELAHVEKNMSGASFKSVPYGDGVRVSESHADSEIEAEATAQRVMAAPLSPTSSAGTLGAGPSQGNGEQISHSGEPAVQRALRIGQRDVTAEYHQEASGHPVEVQQQILRRLTGEIDYYFKNLAAQDLTEEERKMFVREKPRIFWQLSKAIVSPVGMKNVMHPVLGDIVGKHPDFGAKNHDIRVNDYTELARNLMGWVYAKDKRRSEKENAHTVRQDENINLFLDVLLRRLHRYTSILAQERQMSPDQIDTMERELRSGLSQLESQPIKHGRYDPEKAGRPIGSYLAHFDGTMNPEFRGTHLDAGIVQRGGFLTVMANPEAFEFREKMIALHDLSEYFGHSRHTPPGMGKGAVREMTEDDKQSTYEFDEQGRRVSTVIDRGQNRTHPSTRDENSRTTIEARERDIPVWAGQSYTAARMFRMASDVGSTAEEIAAVGWGIFAFWRTDFDHTTEFAYHTLHEVMDIAQNFDIPYNVDNQYASFDMVNPKRIGRHLGRAVDEMRGVRNAADHRLAAMQERKREKGRRFSDRDELLLKDIHSFVRRSNRLYTEIRDIESQLGRWPDLAHAERAQFLLDRTEDLNYFIRKIEDAKNELAKFPRKSGSGRNARR